MEVKKNLLQLVLTALCAYIAENTIVLISHLYYFTDATITSAIVLISLNNLKFVWPAARPSVRFQNLNHALHLQSWFKNYSGAYQYDKGGTVNITKKKRKEK